MAISNLLLDALPPDEREEVLALCRPVPLPQKTVLLKAGRLPQYVYLMTSGVASVVSPMGTGEAVEVGLVGREGLTASYHMLGDQLSVSDCLVQVEGTALRTEYRTFQRAFERLPGLHRRVLEYVQHTTLYLQQLAACNVAHLSEERLARWLLMFSDRAESAELPLTQEFMAQMLGTRRSTVTVIAQVLQQRGLVEYRRGSVTIADRAGLQSTACACYDILSKLRRGLYQTQPKKH